MLKVERPSNNHRTDTKYISSTGPCGGGSTDEILMGTKLSVILTCMNSWPQAPGFYVLLVKFINRVYISYVSSRLFLFHA